MRPLLLAAIALASLVSACSGDPGDAAIDSGPGADASGDAAPPSDAARSDAAPNDGGTDSALSSDGSLPFACSPPAHPNPCPSPSGKSGEASFCYRPGWAGVTGVDVYVGVSGQPSDWSAPLLSLTNDGSGMFSATTKLADGSYPYVFRVHGTVDGLVKDGTYLRDPENAAFQPTVTGAPPRSLSVVTIPQTASPTHHLKGTVTYGGAAQPCYSVDLEVGELRNGSMVVSEHGTGAFTETAADGTFDFTVADGELGVEVRYPFGLTGTYPDPLSTPSLGMSRTGTVLMGSDQSLPSLDIAYPLADYAKMAPAPGAMTTLPVTFQFSIIPGSTLAQVSVTSTNIAGNDPAFASGFATSTSVMWDGTFGGKGGVAKTGTTYYWGTWQEASAKTGWTGESLLFPIVFQ